MSDKRVPLQEGHKPPRDNSTPGRKSTAGHTPVSTGSSPSKPPPPKK